MRKDIREGVMIYVINEIKPNYAALAKQHDCDYRTVKSAYEEAKEKDPKPTARKKRPSKLDPYREIIQDKVKDRCSAYSIFKFIQRKGFEGSYSLVKTYCREFKQEKAQKATVRVEHTPGLSAQVDWKENMHLISNQGEIFEFNIFLYVLPYSKKKFITLTFDRKQDTLFECLDDAFYHTGGVPKEIWFDNMKTVVDQSRSQFSKVHFNDRFYAFSKDAGFKPIQKQEADLFFQLLAMRYEHRSTIITTNIVLSRWGELFQSPEIAAAILDRLVHHVKVFKITGKSYRMRNKI